ARENQRRSARARRTHGGRHRASMGVGRNAFGGYFSPVDTSLKQCGEYGSRKGTVGSADSGSRTWRTAGYSRRCCKSWRLCMSGCSTGAVTGFARDGAATRRSRKRKATWKQSGTGWWTSIWRSSSIGSPHQRLLAKLRRTIRDERIVHIIGTMLRAGVVMSDGVVIATEEGTPQGGPLSPLLS